VRLKVKFFSFKLSSFASQSASGFFPASDEIDNRYSEISGLKYVDYENFSDIRKQPNLPVRSSSNPYFPPTLQNHQIYQQHSQYPQSTINHASAIRKRPKFPYQFVSPSPNSYYTNSGEYPADLSNSIYQNYANYYQYASSSPSLSSSSTLPSAAYYEYDNPTRYPSPPSSANLYGHQTLHQQQQHYSPNYYTNNYANQFGYQRPSSSSSPSSSLGISNFFNNVRDANSPGPISQLSQVGTQLNKALEDISLNDDLQCVPKLLCSMIRNPRKPNQLPSFLNIPGITA
jgi:hypothetical protein